MVQSLQAAKIVNLCSMFIKKLSLNYLTLL